VSPHMTKEELREDPVLEQIQRGVAFAEHNARWLIIGAVIVVAAVAGGVALHRGQLRAQRDASQYLLEGQGAYLQGNYSAAETQLKEMLQTYGRSPSAPAAQITLGDALMAQQRPEEALQAYQSAEGRAGRDPLLAAAAQRGQAAALEDLGRLPEASQAYEKAAGIGTLGQVQDLIAAARTALQASDPARAKSLLERAKKADRGSENLGEITAYTARADVAQP